MNATYDPNTNILTLQIPLMPPTANAKGTLMVAKISGQKMGMHSSGKSIAGNVQLWLQGK